MSDTRAGGARHADGAAQAVTVGSACKNKVYHIPNSDGKPICGATPNTKHRDAGDGYYAKDPSVLPHHSLCLNCERVHDARNDRHNDPAKRVSWIAVWEDCRSGCDGLPNRSQLAAAIADNSDVRELGACIDDAASNGLLSVVYSDSGHFRGYRLNLPGGVA